MEQHFIDDELVEWQPNGQPENLKAEVQDWFQDTFDYVPLPYVVDGKCAIDLKQDSDRVLFKLAWGGREPADPLA